MRIMGVEGHDGFAVPSRIVLAREQPFRLGALQVEPVTCQVRFGQTRETLEPRVMQVLVALARANGEAVTRDDLIDWCWSGRIVGDDAVNRVLARIRRLASGLGGGSFAVETIRGVGYRLTTDAECADALPDVPPETGRASPLISRRPLLIGLGAAAAATVGGVAWLSRPHQPLALASLYYQRGLELRGQNSVASNEQAIAYFRQATRIDPVYADAWGALAWAYRAALEYGPRDDSASIHKFSVSAAQRALELDTGNMDARASLLLLKPFYRNWSEIEKGCSELLKRDPAHDISRYNLANVLTETGRWRESIPHLAEVARRQPFWSLARSQLARALFASGRLEEGDEQMEFCLRQWPRRIDLWQSRIRQLLLLDRWPEAIALAENESAQPVDNADVVAFDRLLVRAYTSGSPALRRQTVDALLKSAQAGGNAVPGAALDLAMFGESDFAFEMFDGYYFGLGRWGSNRAERLSTRFLFYAMTASLRRDPRFETLVAKVGLDSYWRSTGKQPDYRRSA